jgi:hypothetical protein
MHRLLALLASLFTLAQIYEWVYSKYKDWKNDSDNDNDFNIPEEEFL